MKTISKMNDYEATITVQGMFILMDALGELPWSLYKGSFIFIRKFMEMLVTF